MPELDAEILDMIFTGGFPRHGTVSDRETRKKHIICAILLMSRRFPPDNVAALFGVSRSTVYGWAERAMGYDDPEVETLRRLTGWGVVR